eukprot:5010568-Amphidinium_carterae.1
MLAPKGRTVEVIGLREGGSIMWALATLAWKQSLPLNLVAAWAENQVTRAMEHLKSAQSLVALVWSFAALGSRQVAFFRTVASVVQSRFQHPLQMQDVANIAWSYAAMSTANNALFDVLMSRAGELMQEAMDMEATLEPKHISMLLWACAMLQYQPTEATLSVSIASSLHFINDFSSLDLAQVAWAHTQMQHAPDALMNRIGAVLQTRGLSTLPAQDLVILSEVDHLSQPVTDMITAELCSVVAVVFTAFSGSPAELQGWLHEQGIERLGVHGTRLLLHHHLVVKQ